MFVLLELFLFKLVIFLPTHSLELGVSGKFLSKQLLGYYLLNYFIVQESGALIINFYLLTIL